MGYSRNIITDISSIKILPLGPRTKNLVGKKSGNLEVVGYVGKNKKGTQTRWLCACSCGNYTLVEGGNLSREHSTSCGCIATSRIVKHNTKHGMRDSRIYDCWRSMKQRCNDENADNYKYYGGRGITYDSRWESFESFYEDMKEGYSDSKTLDRIDSNGSYCKHNCKWSTSKEQSHNRRSNKMVMYRGEEHKLVELYEELGCTIRYKTVLDRLYTGWDAERALTEPIKEGY